MVTHLSNAFSAVFTKVTSIHKRLAYSLKYFGLTTFTLTTLLLSQHAFALSNVTAVVDKNPAMMNESILLTITADDDVDRDALDTSPLAKDFIVGQTRVSSQTSIVNFDATRLTTWKIILISRKAGQYVIPALTVDNLTTKPINLTVISAKNNANQSQNDIFITSELSSNEVYVQQSLTLSIKLHFSINLHSASMEKPEFTGAIIDKVGEDQQSDSIINGKRYRIIEQTYSVTPEQSGEFTIKGPVFSGEVSDGTTRHSTFRSFAQTKPVSVIGNDIKLNVLPIPASYPSNAQWLPTDILTLHEEWQDNNGEFIVGEPITRTIRLTASGLSKAQLPKLTMQSTRGLKIYPDQPELHSSLRDNRLISQKVQNFALVPSAAGDFTLPEMTVTWFNTVTNKIEQARLPEQTITVTLPKDGSVIAPFNNVNDTPILNEQVNQGFSPQSGLTNNTVNSSPATVINAKSRDYLQWLYLCLWLVTLVMWFAHVRYLNRRQSPNSKSSSKTINNNENHYVALISACKSNNAESALHHVLPWLKQILVEDKSGNEIRNIAQALHLINDEAFSNSFNELQAHLYGKNSNKVESAWQGELLRKAVIAINKKYQASNLGNQSISLNP